VVEVFREVCRIVRVDTGNGGAHIGKKPPADGGGQAIADLDYLEPFE